MLLTQQEVGRLIEKGLAVAKSLPSDYIIMESQKDFFIHQGTSYCVCALGLAVIGRYNDAHTAYVEFKKIFDARSDHVCVTFAHVLNIKLELAQWIARYHSYGTPASDLSKQLKHIRTVT